MMTLFTLRNSSISNIRLRPKAALPEPSQVSNYDDAGREDHYLIHPRKKITLETSKLMVLYIINVFS